MTVILRRLALSFLSLALASPAAAQTLGAPTVPDAGFAAPTAPTVAPDAGAAPAAKPKPRVKPRAAALRETAIPTDPTPTYTSDTTIAR
jgi:hypothetical protein